MDRSVIRLTDEEENYHSNRAFEVLNYLKAVDDWVPTRELIPINHRFSDCIFRLRNQGYIIDRRKMQDKTFEWKYEGWKQVEKVTAAWREGYYSSRHWRRMRQLRLSFDGVKCCRCHNPDAAELQVHHWEYNLFNEKLEDLMTLCDGCHGVIHDLTPIHFPRSVTIDIFRQLDDDGQDGPQEQGVLFE
jgi:hypothetical protein